MAAMDFVVGLFSPWASLVAQTVKNLPTVRETGVRSLGWEDPLEKEMATHSSILAWRITWTEEPGKLQSRRVTKLNTTEQLTLSLFSPHIPYTPCPLGSGFLYFLPSPLSSLSQSSAIPPRQPSLPPSLLSHGLS